MCQMTRVVVAGQLLSAALQVAGAILLGYSNATTVAKVFLDRALWQTQNRFPPARLKNIVDDVLLQAHGRELGVAVWAAYAAIRLHC